MFAIHRHGFLRLGFFGWCEDRGIQRLDQIEPMVVAAYIEQHPGSALTVKQHLAAIRMCFDWLVTGQVVRQNPATSIKGPKHIVTRGKTPVLAADSCAQGDAHEKQARPRPARAGTLLVARPAQWMLACS
jgi:hypothetical protein